MIFLPIADRELRVSARKRSTFWVRVAAAAVALIIGTGFFVLTLLGPVFGGAGMGRYLFLVLTWLALVGALCAGLFFTSDSLSEEKREGTLGFLFLTDLRGGDIVIGKLVAAGLRGLYGLLAVLPILGLTLLMGGVTGLGFFKTALALLNALLASLAAGLFASAISRDPHKALAVTLALLGFWVAAGPVTDAILARIGQRAFEPLLSVSSPGYLFVAAHSWGRTPFWWPMFVNQFLVWTCVGLSCLLVPRTWQDKPSASTRRAFASARRRASLRQTQDNPIVWLTSLDRWPIIALWTTAVLVTAGLGAMFAVTQKMVWLVWGYVGSGLSMVVYLFVASQAARFFVEARRAGVLELLLTTPLTGEQIVRGQWRALLRTFALPLALFVVAEGVGTYMAQQQTWGLTAAMAATPAPATATNVTAVTNLTVMTTTLPAPGMPATTVAAGVGAQALLIAALSVAATASMVFALAASVWFGMWMGLTSRSTILATLKTMFWVHILPWFAVGFLAGILVSLVLIPSMMKGTAAPAVGGIVWYAYLSSALGIVLYIGVNLFFCLWARRKLYSEFRARAAATPGQEIFATTTPAPGTQ